MALMMGCPRISKGRPNGRPRISSLKPVSPDGDLCPVALLVLLARAAGAGIVAADLGILARRGLRPLRSLDLGRSGELDPGRHPLLAEPLLEHLLLGHGLV